MATDSIAGLFMTPEMYQQQQQQQSLQQGVDLAKLDPGQYGRALTYAGSRGLGQALGGIMGAQDPMLQRVATRNHVMQQLDPTNPQSVQQGIQALVQAGDAEGARSLYSDMLARQETQSKITKNLREGNAAMLTPEQRNYKAATDGGYTGTFQEWLTSQKQSAGGGEFERLIAGLDLTPEQKKAAYQQRAQALLNPDPSGLKGLNAQLAALQLEQRQFKFDQDRQKATDEKQQAITKLAGVESSVEDSLATAEKALKLAPGSFLQASGQALTNNIPWGDARSLKNLVSSLNSDKAIGTLQDLKAQSKTGATGFGALNTKELQLILDKTRSLDPSDKMFKENLQTVMEGWQKIRVGAMESRVNLQGKGPQLQELRGLIAKGKAQGWTKDEKARAEALKAETGVQ